MTVEQIPTPRPAGWVTDLTGTLPAETLAELNRLGDEVKARTGAELAVVVVGTAEGAEPRDFATRLFNAWGIGQAGKDNGLLVFAALDDRAAEIVLGDGLIHGSGGPESEAIMRDEMIPRFRQGDPSGAILAGARACARRILDVAPSDVASSELTTSGEASGPFPAPSRDDAQIAPPQQMTFTPPPRSGFDPRVLFPIGLVGTLVAVLVAVFRKPRCPRCKEKMAMLEESEDDAYLANSEQVEERVGSVDHQVWVCPACGERKKRRFLRFGSSYGTCPECSARTLRFTSTTVETATYDHGGRVQEDRHCANCSYSHSYIYATPMLHRPTDDDDLWSSSSSLSSSSSASSGWSASSNSSSSSSDSGFGGGHSSGGGASGRW